MSTLTVFVVDDSAVDRRLAGGLVEKDPALQVRYAANGAEAMENVRNGEPVDVVITDLVMPEMDGLELVAESGRRIRTSPPFS